MFIMSPLLSASALVALGVVSAKGGDEATRSPDSGIELPLPEVPVSETVNSPYKGKAKWTMYYVVDVKAPAKTGAGTGKTVELLDGSKVKYFWSKSEISKMRMEATALIVDIDGSQQPITRVGPGRWQAIPADHYSKGNRGNMLYPWVHVAADQSIYRYGSRVYCKAADGKVTADGKIHDGYFWVADTGGRIKGKLRFDLFVGRSNVYMEMMNRSRNPSPEVVIDRLPDPPKGMDPKTKEGTRRIFKGLGYSPDEAEANESNNNHQGGGLTYSTALRDFQEKHHRIPHVEYGNTRGAVTLWYLTHAALAVQKVGKE
jgi:3D (Asp-Asp-Asp) domain-containing protein